jgi:HSP20 family protein
MKKVLVTLITSSLFACVNINAQPINYEDEFQRMNQIMNSMISSNLNRAVFKNVGYPRIDVQNKKKVYIYKFDVAGVKKQNLKLTIDENNILTLEGKKENKSKNKDNGYIRQEIFYGSFKRVIQLPEDANQDKLSTKYNSGILEVTISKKKLKTKKAKVIKIL